MAFFIHRNPLQSEIIKYLSTLGVIILLWGCSPKSCPDFNLGTFVLQSSSKLFLPPYSEEQSLILTNDMAEEVKLIPFQFKERMDEDRYKLDCSGDGESFAIRNKELIHYSLQDEVNDWWLLFRASVYMVPPEYQNNQIDTLMFDYFYLRIGSIVSPINDDPEPEQIELKWTNPRGNIIPNSFQEIYSDLNSEYEILDSVLFNNQTYRDILKFDTLGNTILLSKEIGVLQVELNQRGKWTFNRLEEI